MLNCVWIPSFFHTTLPCSCICRNNRIPRLPPSGSDRVPIRLPGEEEEEDNDPFKGIETGSDEDDTPRKSTNTVPFFMYRILVPPSRTPFLYHLPAATAARLCLDAILFRTIPHPNTSPPTYI